jgi:FtsP/CotA-like multicopper oxidase with cupredoxin domain
VSAEIQSVLAKRASATPRELTLALRVRDLPFGLTVSMDSSYFPPVEWTDAMPMMNWLVTAKQAEWILREPATGRENMQIDWSFRTGDLVRLRITNDVQSFHPMYHPIHVHGQRFLVLAHNDAPVTNQVWKDTVIVPVGGSVDLLVEMSNPGRWMLHCHISEHLEAGMHTVFTVTAPG